jgi:hypothetical protein
MSTGWYNSEEKGKMQGDIPPHFKHIKTAYT